MPNFINPNLPTKTELLSVISLYLQTSGNIQATEHNELETAMLNAIYGGQIGDIKELAVDSSYINTHFDMTDLLNPGKGKVTGERYGWAICNGKNGTIDKGGNVSVGYNPNDTDFDNLTQPGINSGLPGTKTVTLGVNQIPSHFHHAPGSSFKSFVAGSNDYRIEYSQNNSSTGVGGDNNSNNTEIAITNLGSTYNTGGAALERSIGGGQSHNNMPPYIVTLFIQRIAPY